jgi:Protein of unknown function (DUF3300)
LTGYSGHAVSIGLERVPVPLPFTSNGCPDAAAALRTPQMNPVLRASTASVLTVVFSFVSTVSGCKSAPAPAPQEQAAAPAQAAPVSAPAAAPMSVDDLVAPIALYPDQLLAQILTASTNAQEVLDGGNWLLQNQNLKGDALTDAAKQAGFSPPMQYLMSFPQVVDNMCQQIDWTRQLGQDFQADQKGVMEAVQRKRAQAQQTGNLKSSPQMTVETKKAENGQPYVEIQPANPQVIYVPQYNPVTIYTTPAPTTTVVTQAAPASTGVSTGTAVAIGLLSFGVGMAVGAAINRNNYYPYPSWGYGGVYYGGRPYYPPPYRPVYPGYRPAYGYHPPPNYHWNQYNRNVNVNVNNNYYNKFNNNTYNRNNVNNNINKNINANNRPALGAGNQAGQPNWKGQSTYQGARPNTPNQRPGSSMANVNPANRPNAGNNLGAANRPNGGYNGAAANRPNAGNNVATANRPNVASSPGGNNMNRPNTASPGAINRPNAANPGTMNRAAAPSNMNRGGDRGYSTATARPAGGGAPAARPAPQAQNRGGGNSAFSNSGSGRAERAASNRGQASMGGGGRARAR